MLIEIPSFALNGFPQDLEISEKENIKNEIEYIE